MTIREILQNIYKEHKIQILFFITFAFIWSIFLFPGGCYMAFADTAINTPSSLSLDTFQSSSAEVATSFMETIGVSADPYTVLTFIGTLSRLNDYFEWNLNIVPGLMKYDVIFYMVVILFAISKISKCFGSTKALTMIHFSEIEKWVGFLFTVLLSSSVFIDLVVTHSNSNQCVLPFLMPFQAVCTSAVVFSTVSNVLLIILSLLVTLISWAIYYVVKIFFDFLDIITLPLSLIPGATFLYEAVKTLGILAVMVAIMLFPIIGFILCVLIVIVAAFFFKKSYAAMLYFRKIYIRPFFCGIFGYSLSIPLIHKRIPSKVQKLFPDSSISLAIPVYNLRALKKPKIRRYTKLWLVCSSEKMYLCMPTLKQKDFFLGDFSNTLEHPIYLKKSRRFFEIFSTPKGEDIDQKYRKISKEYHIVFSKEYLKRIDEILNITGYEELILKKKKFRFHRKDQKKP